MLEVAEKIKDDNAIIKSNLYLSNTYFRSKLMTQSIKTIDYALEHFETSKNTDSILLTKILINKGKLLGSLKQYNKALSVYDKAKIINQKSNYNKNNADINRQLCAIYINVGVILKAQKKYKKAIRNFKLASNLSNEINDQYKFALANLNIGQGYVHMQEIDSSSLYTNKALNILIKLKRPYFIKECYENLSYIELQRSDYKKSLEYLKLHHKFKDSVINIKQMQKSLQHQNNYAIKLVNEKNKLKNEIKESEYQSKIWFWTLFSILLVLALLILFLLFKKSRQNENLIALNLKNRELNQILQQIKQALNVLKKDQHTEITPILKEISQQINIESDRKELELFINEKHTEFFFKLKQKEPSLTKKELRLSSLLLTGLTSKEIADLLSISSASVDMSRYRLRKKLNIPSEKSISIFLSEL